MCIRDSTNIMGRNVPSLTIPVKLGRNIAVIVEVAAMNNRQKKMGYNAAVELNNSCLLYTSRCVEETGAGEQRRRKYKRCESFYYRSSEH